MAALISKYLTWLNVTRYNLHGKVRNGGIARRTATSSYSSSGNSVFIRKATLENRQDIWDINHGIYDGLDYLPHFYDRYVQDENHLCFVGEYKGGIFGYLQYTLVDGGTTAIRQAARISQNVSKLGLYKQLQDFTMDDLQKQHSEIERVLYTAVLSDIQKMKTSRDSKRSLILEKRNWKPFMFDYRSVQPGDSISDALRRDLGTSTDSRGDIIREVSGEWLVEILQTEHITRELFPSGYIISFWEPFSITRGLLRNINHIMNRSWVYASCPVNGELPRESSNPPAISFGTPMTCAAGYRLDIDFYGSSLDQLEAHVLAHCVKAYESKPPGLNLIPILYFPESIPFEETERLWLEQHHWTVGLLNDADHRFILAQVDQNSDP